SRGNCGRTPRWFAPSRGARRWAALRSPRRSPAGSFISPAARRAWSPAISSPSTAAGWRSDGKAMTGERFIYQASPQRVLFGSGTLADLPAEAERLALRRILVLSTAGHRALAEEAAMLLGGLSAGTFTDARMHTPVEITAQAMAVVRSQ